MDRRRPHPFTRRLREEDGGFLIEIVVSAAILLTVAVGVMGAFDAAGEASSQQRSQAVAANLATSEMERVRSLKFSSLVGLDQTRDVTVGANKYTVRSQTSEGLATSPSGAPCESASRSAETVRLTTTVTWPTQGGKRPVRFTSMIAAPANASSTRGSVIVQVLDKDGVGVSALDVSVTGASTASGTTDVNGCVRFTDLLAQNGYRLKFERATWKTPDGRTAVDDPVDVVGGVTQTKSYQYDPPAPTQANFFYTTDGKANGTRVDAPQSGGTWVHANLPGQRETQVIDPVAKTLLSITLPTISDQYGAYAGTCTTNQPPAANLAAVSSGATVDARVPTVRVRLTVDGSGFNGAQVFVRNPCDTSRIALGTTGTVSGTSGRVLGGVPYSPGTLTICAQALGQHYQVTGRTVTNFSDLTDITLAAISYGASRNTVTGNCP